MSSLSRGLICTYLNRHQPQQQDVYRYLSWEDTNLVKARTVRHDLPGR